MGKLTAIGVKALVQPGRFTDGDGLHLHVRSADRRAWVLRYMRGGKARDMGLGPYPRVTLAQARQKAEAARKVIREGGDPFLVRQKDVQSRETAAGRTFQAAAEALIDARGAGWRNEHHKWQWSQTLKNHAYPVFGDWPVTAVDTEAVLRALQPIWNTKPETASRLRGRIEAVLDAAKARHWRTGENPARWKGHLAILLPNPTKVRKVVHMPSLPWQKIPAFMSELLTQTSIAARPLRLLILTASRAGMVRTMERSDVDLEAKLWTVPGHKMKAGIEHRVPLSAAAVALLAEVFAELAPARPGQPDYVFPNARGKPLSDMTLTVLLRRMNGVEDGSVAPWRDGKSGELIVPHGFRSTFRVWAGEQTVYPREIIEAAMAHAVEDKVEAAYQRSDLLEKRRALMEDWGSFSSVAVR